MKKYYSIDKNMETMIKDGILANFTAPFEDYYNTFRIDGGALLDKERYTESYEALKWALKVSSFFYEQKWYSSPLDTSITFYAGYAAMKANNANDAVTWFKKLADANASGTDIQIAYGWLANYYYETAKDNAAAKEVVDKGLRYYPKDQYLLDLKIRLERENNNWASIFSTHEKTTADPKAGFTENLSYGADLYDYIFGDGMDANDRIDKELKLVQVLGKAITFKPQSADANYLMGMYYSQKVLEGIDAAKQETDAAKKQNINKTIKENSGNATKYLEAAVTNFEAKGISSLKESSKDNYKQCLSNLIYFYSKSNNMAKMKEAEEKKKGL